MHVRFSATNGDLASLGWSIIPPGMAKIGVAAEVSALLLQTKRGKNGGQSSTLTLAMPTGGGASVAQV